MKIENPFDQILNEVKHSIASVVPNVDTDFIIFDKSPNHVQSHYSFSTFSYNELLKTNPTELATAIAYRIRSSNNPVIQDVTSTGPYVNILLNRNLFSKNLLQHIIQEGRKYGKQKKQSNKSVVINISNSVSDLSWFNTVLPNSFKYLSYKILKQKYEGNEFSLDPASIVKEVLEKDVATYISNTNAVITKNFISTESSEVVLQKNDGSFTSYTWYLAYLKRMSTKYNPEKIVNIFPSKQLYEIAHLFKISKQLGHFTNDLELVFILLDSQDTNENFDNEMNREKIKKIIYLFKNEAINYDSPQYFETVQLLADFPNVIKSIAQQHKPLILRKYLLDLMLATENLGSEGDSLIAKAVEVVINNGLRLLKNRVSLF